MKLPLLSGRQVYAALERLGFREIHRKGSHVKMEHLLDRLEGYDHCILAFLENFDIPFTNNEPERAFRFLKTRMKISGCFRTLAGARRHIRIYSYISTLRKNHLDVLDHLRSALQGHPFLLPFGRPLQLPPPRP